MSNHPIDHPARRIPEGFILAIGMLLVFQMIWGQEAVAADTGKYPMIVRVRPGDTPSTLARRYLNDVSKAWMIKAYNNDAAMTPNGAVLIPRAPFRLGGLTPDGFQNVPVLAYLDPGAESSTAERAFAATFRQHMTWLKKNGYAALSPSQLLQFLNYSGQLPEKSIFITADMQSRWFYDYMAPVLKELGFTATVFVATGHVGDTNAMTWDHLKRLYRDGFFIGCRGENGRSLARRKPGQSFETNFKWIESELKKAKVSIEAHLGEPCLLLAYPQGGTNGLIAAVAAKMGFSAAFTLSSGENPFYADRFLIHRTIVDNRTGPEQFRDGLVTRIEADLK